MQLFLQLATQQTLCCKSRKKLHNSCNTPFSQPAMQQIVALQIAEKVELSSSFPIVARQVAVCNTSSASCIKHKLHSCRMPATQFCWNQPIRACLGEWLLMRFKLFTGCIARCRQKLCVAPPLQLAMFLGRHRCVALVAGKITSCNIAFCGTNSKLQQYN